MTTTKKTATPNETEPAATPVETPAAKKPKLSYAAKLALLPPEEAAAIRAKANEASRKSRAKKLGLNPEDLTVRRLEKAVDKAKAKLTAATDEFDAALLALNTAKEEMENDDAEEA